jgi:hypothetical protein
MTILSVRWLSCCGVLVGGLGLLGCSDEAVGKRAPGNDEAATKRSTYGLKVLVERKGKTEVVRVVPADFAPGAQRVPTRFAAGHPDRNRQAASFPELEDEPRGPQAPGVKPLATVDGPGTDPIDTQQEDIDGGRASGTTLMLWALASCTREADGVFASSSVFAPNEGSAYGYYAFAQGVRSCDQGLYYQEALLCAANRLAQVADSVGTVTWTTADPGSGSSSDPPDPEDNITVTVPPQATEDRFIARDIALNALAHLARLQLVTPLPAPWTDAQKVCVDAYGYAAETGYVPVEKKTFPFSIFTGNPTPLVHFEPFEGQSWSSLSIEQTKQLGSARLKQQALITVAAQGLLQELVEKNFRDDLAGAEKLKSAAPDPAEGLRAFWGVPTAGGVTNPYNTMRHALRLLFGRLEAADPDGPNASWRPIPVDQVPPIEPDDHGQMSADPKCTRDGDGAVGAIGFYGFGALEVMDAVGDGFEYRFEDIPPTSPAQARAVSMLEREGIVLPDTFPELTTPQQFRDAVVAQLIRNAAASAGATYPAYASTPQGLAIKETIAELSDADLRFALDRVHGMFLMAAHQYRSIPDELGTVDIVHQATSAGMSTVPIAQTPEVSALSGAVLVGGIPRKALQRDVIGSLAGAQIASDCGSARCCGASSASCATVRRSSAD